MSIDDSPASTTAVAGRVCCGGEGAENLSGGATAARKAEQARLAEARPKQELRGSQRTGRPESALPTCTQPAAAGVMPTQMTTWGRPGGGGGDGRV